MTNQSVHDFVFHYNCYTKKWNAVHRDHYAELFSGNKGNVISSSTVETLVHLINKSGGDIIKIHNLVG